MIGWCIESVFVDLKVKSDITSVELESVDHVSAKDPAAAVYLMMVSLISASSL